ncbi:four-carbon acid sugar kinase family protein [Thermodesulfobacteriota bacterium]
MSEPTIDISYIDTLPPEWQEDLLPRIQQELGRSTYKVVVLDDDPTGTQTVRDIPVLTTWSVAALEEELSGDFPAFFILTNSRSLTEDAACDLAREIGENLYSASQKSGVRVVVISRSDSTLRGHFPSEVDASAQALNKDQLPYLIVPFFLEGGRFTLNDIHYVKELDSLVPASMTPFAKDAAFGFANSNLKNYIEEKTGGKIKAEEVISVSLQDIRVGGPDQVADIFRSVPKGTACFVNAASYRDMEVVVSALIKVENEGYEFLYRTAASFVRSRIGLDAGDGLLAGDQLVSPSDTGGLFVIGSYVPKTTSQVSALFDLTDVAAIEVQVDELLDESRRASEIERVVSLTNQTLGSGADAAIYTSRSLVSGSDAASSLEIGRIVSESLVEIVSSITHQPRYLVAKGGITSSDIATKALGIKRALIIGQALPGVPAWRCGEETRYPGMTYIVFPGNVGEDDALAQIVKKID